MFSKLATTSAKRFSPKTMAPAAAGARAFSSEFFPGIGKIQYDPASKATDLTFKHYNADEVIMGKTMKEWCRFSVVWWHTMRWGGQDPFSGAGTLTRPWEDGTDSVDMAKVRCDAAFEFFNKLGVEYYCFHDIDIAPEGANLLETEKIFHEVTDHALMLQKEHDVKLLWATQNLFSHPRFMNGASTNPDLDSYAWACAKTKIALDVGLKCGGENHVFWGGREGYMSHLNTDVRLELDNMAAFLKMSKDYANSIGYDAQFLIEPKPREPTKHQYDYDAQTVMGFLNHYDLQDDFKLNIEPNHTTLAGHDYEHDLWIASKCAPPPAPPPALTRSAPPIVPRPGQSSNPRATAALPRPGTTCSGRLTATPATLWSAGTPTSSPWTSRRPPWP